MVTYYNKEKKLERVTFSNDMKTVNHVVTGSDGYSWELKESQNIRKNNSVEDCLLKLGVVKLRQGQPLKRHQGRLNEIVDFYDRNKNELERKK